MNLHMSINNIVFDDVDRKISLLLSGDASLTNAALGEQVGLSSSAVNERVRRLKAHGKIKDIVALVDCEFVDMAMGAFIYVLIDNPAHNQAFLERIMEYPSILECHHVTGEYSYLLKVRVAHTRALESFITDLLKNQAGVIKTLTQIILSSPKEKSVIVG